MLKYFSEINLDEIHIEALNYDNHSTKKKKKRKQSFILVM